MTIDGTAFIQLFCEAIERDPAAVITMSDRLDQISEWDSLGVLSFISLVDDRLQVTLDSELLHGAVTVGDLCELVNR